ncbi:amino acid transporter [Acephala macrosclerotiorum]|nr:amino acid transporter [Acephala macrosclerotiorum]
MATKEDVGIGPVKADELPTHSVGIIEIQDASGRKTVVQLDELCAADRALAEQFGYNPVFKREFGYLSTFSFAMSISGLFASTTITFVYPLEAGGAASVVCRWIISGAGCMCIAASVAELMSAYPTCGGLYYTISRLAPKDRVPSISWVVGWINLLGQVAGVSSSEYGSAQLLLAAVSIGQDFQWYPNIKQTVGVAAALTVLSGVVNSLSTYWMEKITKVYVIFHFVALTSCGIALLAKTNHKHNASYVFTHVEGSAGWSPVGWSFLFGFLSASWTMTDYDATAHITEEINEPQIKAARALFFAILCTYVVGWLFNVVLVFCMGDPAEILASPIYQPVVQIYYNSLGKGAGILFTVAAFVILQFGSFTATQALARTVFTYSRDRLLPFSNIWKKINRFTGTPLYAVWISIFWCIAINLIALGSYIAIAGVFSVCAIALDWSYAIPIFCKLAFGKFEPGPWHMGRLSPIVNVLTCIWTFFVSIIFILPTVRPVTANNMNYAIAFLGFILLCAAVYWYSSGKKFYSGPIIEAIIHEKRVIGSLEENEKRVNTSKSEAAA